MTENGTTSPEPAPDGETTVPPTPDAGSATPGAGSATPGAGSAPPGAPTAGSFRSAAGPAEPPATPGAPSPPPSAPSASSGTASAPPGAPTAGTPPPAAGPAGWATPPPWASGPAPRGSGVRVPTWLLLVVCGLLVFGAGFGIGWVAAPGGSGHTTTRVGPFGQNLPGFGRVAPGFGFGNGAGNSGNGHVRGGFLGVTVQSANDNGGAQIVSVASGTPADAAGLKADDVITKVDGTRVPDVATLQQALAGDQAGQTVTITYTRAGSTHTAKVTLGNPSAEFAPAPAPAPTTTTPPA